MAVIELVMEVLVIATAIATLMIAIVMIIATTAIKRKAYTERKCL